jgi:hypothetical protein
MATNAQYYSRMTSWKLQKKAEIMDFLIKQQSIGGTTPEAIKAQWDLLAEETRRLEAMETALSKVSELGVEGAMDIAHQAARSSSPNTSIGVEMMRAERGAREEMIRAEDAGGKVASREVLDFQGEIEGGMRSGETATLEKHQDFLKGKIEDSRNKLEQRLVGTPPLEAAVARQEFARGVAGAVTSYRNKYATDWNMAVLPAWLESEGGVDIGAEEKKVADIQGAYTDDLVQSQLEAGKRGILWSGAATDSDDDRIERGLAGLSPEEMARRQADIEALRAQIADERARLLAAEAASGDSQLDYAAIDREAARIFQERFGTARGQARARGEEFQPRPIFRKREPVDPEVEELIARDVAMTAAPEPVAAPAAESGAEQITFKAPELGTPEASAVPVAETGQFAGVMEQARQQGLSDEDMENLRRGIDAASDPASPLGSLFQGGEEAPIFRMTTEATTEEGSAPSRTKRQAADLEGIVEAVQLVNSIKKQSDPVYGPIWQAMSQEYERLAGSTIRPKKWPDLVRAARDKAIDALEKADKVAEAASKPMSLRDLILKVDNPDIPKKFRSRIAAKTELLDQIATATDSLSGEKMSWHEAKSQLAKLYGEPSGVFKNLKPEGIQQAIRAAFLLAQTQKLQS